MTRLIVEGDLQRTLSELDAVVELCDSSGNVLGKFEPSKATSHPLRGVISSPVSEADLRARREQLWGRPLRDIWASLERR